LSRIGKEIFPLKQFLETFGYSRTMSFLAGIPLIGQFVPCATFLQQCPPATESCFCRHKELVHSRSFWFCWGVHDFLCLHSPFSLQQESRPLLRKVEMRRTCRPGLVRFLETRNNRNKMRLKKSDLSLQKVGVVIGQEYTRANQAPPPSKRARRLHPTRDPLTPPELGPTLTAANGPRHWGNP
jgi:hypothetical protein